MGLLNYFISWVYQLIQVVISTIFSPTPPPPCRKISSTRRIAVIGAGITGVSSAAHCVGHGFEVTIFEAKGRENLGGIWTRVSQTSPLQVHSVMYRFHPSVRWMNDYPHRDAVIAEVLDLWKRYRLDERTIFNVPVHSIWRDQKTGKWIVEDPSYGDFDGIIAAVGTCGDIKMPHIAGQQNYSGKIYHASELAGIDVKDRKVFVIGSGASAVEAVEFAVQGGAAETTMLARSDKWLIPRNPLVDSLIALNILGGQTDLSWIPEKLLEQFFYRDLQELVPVGRGLYTETPMVSNAILEQVRSGRLRWLRGDIKEFVKTGIVFNYRSKGVPKGGPGKETMIEGDICIMATGYHRPSLRFLPDDVFNEPYSPPNWFLQTFPVGHMDICANNCTYISGIGTVGHVHIGIYTRILLMFLTDPQTRPSTPGMRIWVDSTRMWKGGAPGGALEFLTYSELLCWFIFSLFWNPKRWKWIPFVLSGRGSIPGNENGFGKVTRIPNGHPRGQDQGPRPSESKGKNKQGLDGQTI